MTTPRAAAPSGRSQRLLWGALAALAVLWPANSLGMLDGIPLDGRAEAILAGLALPALWWLDGHWVTRGAGRGLIVLLFAWKALLGLALGPQGFCLEFTTPRPITGTAENMLLLDVPDGRLPSWDMRARWFPAAARCSAIGARPYAALADFPGWVTNLRVYATPVPERFDLSGHGYVTVSAAGTLAIDLGSVAGTTAAVNGAPLALDSAGRGSLTVDAGTHDVRWQSRLEDAARLDVRWNDAPAWSSALVTLQPPSTLDRAVGRIAGALTTGLTLLLAVGWAIAAWWRVRPGPLLTLWILVASGALLLAATVAPGQRLAPLTLLAAAALPRSALRRDMTGSFLAIGVPWLVFTAGSSWNVIGRFGKYAAGDDWIIFQVAAWRIFQHGYWLEGGEPAFYWQPLYRWITGALHVVFGDSGVGDTWADHWAVLVGALLAFAITRPVAGPRWGYAAAALVPATITASPLWHFLGRSLAEVTAAGLGWAAAFWLLRSRRGGAAAVAAAALLAAVMVLTRLNLLPFACGLVGLLLPLRPLTALPNWWRRAWRELARPRTIAYLGGLAVALALFVTRTWYYTGLFSLTFGAPVAENTTGLLTLGPFATDVWGRIGRNLLSTVTVTGSADPRGAVVTLGVLAAVLAVVRVPLARHLPLGVAIAILAGASGAFIAQSRGYPGRFSIHLVPLAAALAVALIGGRPTGPGRGREGQP